MYLRLDLSDKLARIFTIRLEFCGKFLQLFLIFPRQLLQATVFWITIKIEYTLVLVLDKRKIEE